MRSTEVELLARRGRLHMLLHNRREAPELYWSAGQVATRPYRHACACACGVWLAG